MPKFEVSKIDAMVLNVNVHLNKGEQNFHLFFAPDAHWDNPKCKRKLYKQHLDEAKEMGAGIIFPGDLFCMMQGKYDPRRSKHDIRPEHNKANYIDAVISDAAEWHRPYKDNILMFGTGNHESAILKNLETNVLERFAGELGGNIPVMGYHGWIVLRIFDHGAAKAFTSYKIYFNHGTGGGGAVTRGQIEFSRLMMCIEGANAIIAGHIHERNCSSVCVHYFEDAPNAFTAKTREVLLIRSSTYKQEYTDGGFHIEKGRPPKPLGGTFVTLHRARTQNESKTIIAQPHFKTGVEINISSTED